MYFSSIFLDTPAHDSKLPGETGWGVLAQEMRSIFSIALLPRLQAHKLTSRTFKNMAAYGS